MHKRVSGLLKNIHTMLLSGHATDLGLDGVLDHEAINWLAKAEIAEIERDSIAPNIHRMQKMLNEENAILSQIANLYVEALQLEALRHRAIYEEFVSMLSEEGRLQIQSWENEYRSKPRRNSPSLERNWEEFCISHPDLARKHFQKICSNF